MRVRDHLCQDHGGGRSKKFADSCCSMDEVRRGYTYFWFPKTFCCGRGHPNSKGFAIIDMSDGEPRLLVGTPTKSGGQITLLVERIFRIQTSEVDMYEKVMTAVHETLQSDKIQPAASKRPADSMVQETPSKKFAPAFLAE